MKNADILFLGKQFLLAFNLVNQFDDIFAELSEYRSHCIKVKFEVADVKMDRG